MGGGGSKKAEQSGSVAPAPTGHEPSNRADDAPTPGPTAGRLASDMSADSDGGREEKASAPVGKKHAHIKTMHEDSNYEKSDLDKFVLKVIPKDNEARNLLTDGTGNFVFAARVVPPCASFSLGSFHGARIMNSSPYTTSTRRRTAG